MDLPNQFHVTAFANTNDCLREAIESCMHGLQSIGYDVTYADSQLRSDAINVVLGSWGGVKAKSIFAQAEHVIIYNWEQILPFVPWLGKEYFKQMAHTHVWDYSRSNVDALKRAGMQDVHHLPMVYAPSMSRVQQGVTQDIDVLFYGSLGARRQAVIDSIRALGLHVVTSNDVGQMTGATRDEYLARSKIVLNMHGQEESAAFEMARVSYLMANRKAIVAEVHGRTDIDDDIRAAIVSGTLEQLPQLCLALIHDEVKRQALERSAYEAFTARQTKQIMGQAVERYKAAWQAKKLGNQNGCSVALPEVLQVGALGGGVQSEWNFSYCNADRNTGYTPDWLFDITQPLAVDASIQSWRFGHHQVKPQRFNKIIAKNVFQRVPDLRLALTNCLELLQDGGLLELTVPYDLSYEAWRHMDDCRAFNDKTWSRIVDNWWQYGWQTHRFEIVSTGYGLHGEYAQKYMMDNNQDWEGALKQPRVIDVLHITLHKRTLNEEEKKQLPHARFME